MLLDEWFENKLLSQGRGSVLILSDDNMIKAQLIRSIMKVLTPAYTHLFAGELNEFNNVRAPYETEALSVKDIKHHLARLYRGMSQRELAAKGGTVIIDPIHLLLVWELERVVAYKPFMDLWSHQVDRGIYTYAFAGPDRLFHRHRDAACTAALCLKFTKDEQREVGKDELLSLCARK